MSPANTRGLRGLALLACLAAPACGVADPVLLLSLDGVPVEAARLRVLLTQGAAASAVLLERNDQNTYVPAPSGSMPAMGAGPSLVRVALDLPASAVGDVLVKVSVERPDMTAPMVPMMPPPLKSYDMACQVIAIETGKVTARTLTLQDGAACPAQ
jgi:hypothetical protein